MTGLEIALAGGIAGLLLIVTILLVRRGADNRALEARLSQLQLGLAELQLQAHNRQTEAHTLATGLNQLQNGLTELRATLYARQDLERQTMESVRRLEAVIAGTQTKGRAGENIVEAVFAQLPPAWQVRNFTLDNRTVEFGMRLPNNLILPIDSKWAATHLLEQFLAADSPARQQQIKREIERTVLLKAREVRQYLHPGLTTPFGVAVLPDAIYDLCAGIQARSFSLNVVLISYSLFVPYLLLVFQTMLRTSQHIDLHRLEAYLNSVEQNLDALQNELEGRYARALRMLDNAGQEMRAQLGQVRGGLSGIQASAHTLKAPAPRSGDAPAPADPRPQ
ncbi:MAG: DNA recombination protein RmuC [Anaerolineae bacterium]|nr:DNA recombination protein RmuC [Anaerolineae bacterium]